MPKSARDVISSLPKGLQPHTLGNIDTLLARIPNGASDTLIATRLTPALASRPEKLALAPSVPIEDAPIHLPTSTKYWRDESLQWEHGKGRAGVPPTDPAFHFRGRGVRSAVHEQYLRMQANVFGLVDENRALNGRYATPSHRPSQPSPPLALWLGVYTGCIRLHTAPLASCGLTCRPAPHHISACTP